MRALVVCATLALLVAGAPAVADSSPVTGGAPGTAEDTTVGARSGAAATRPSPRPSVVRTKRAVLRTVRVSDSRPVAGSRIVVRGRTLARPHRVVLQRRVGEGQWKRVARTTSRNGQFRFAVEVGGPRNRAYRVVVPKQRAKARPSVRTKRAVSPRVVVKPRAPRAVRAPEPAPIVADVASRLEAELDAAVRSYRAEQGLTDVVGTNSCLDEWAAGHAGRMANSGIFAHSVSSEWRDFGVVRSDEACVGSAPAYRAEAIDFVAGDDPAQVAAAAVANWKSAWMHDEVLLDTFGTNRTLSFGVARGLSPVTSSGARTPVWYVVAVVARDLP